MTRELWGWLLHCGFLERFFRNVFARHFTYNEDLYTELPFSSSGAFYIIPVLRSISNSTASVVLRTHLAALNRF